MRRKICLMASAVSLLPVSVLQAAEEAPVPPSEQLAQCRCAALAALGAVLVCIGVLALLSVYGVVRAREVRRNGERLRAHTRRAFLVGVLTSFVAVLLAMLAGVLPEPLSGLCGLALILSVVYMGVGGLCVVAHELGDSVLSNVNSRHAGSSFASVLTGGALLGLCGLALGVGQVLQLLACILGLGVFVGGLAAKRRGVAAVGETATGETASEQPVAEATE
jgi:hypothetical protein